MRKSFISTLIELAEKDSRVFLLTADLGFSFLEPFAEKFPDRFINVGVAEQNMLGIATGLAEGGFIPYVYSIATFAALRPFEFIRNGPVLQNLPVRIVGVGCGFEYDFAGPTHYALEDIGVLRMLPGLHIVTPGDALQCRTALMSEHDFSGPIYFRLGKNDQYQVPGLNGDFTSGKLQVVRDGADQLIIAMGSAVSIALDAANLLAEKNIYSTVVLISSVSPIPAEDLKNLLMRFTTAITIEAHYTIGGIGSMVSEVIAENNLDCKLKRIGVSQNPSGMQGDQNYLNRYHGISSERIVEVTEAEIQNRKIKKTLAQESGYTADWNPTAEITKKQ